MKLKSLLPMNEVVGEQELTDDPIHQFDVQIRNDFHPEFPYLVVINSTPTPVVVFVKNVEDARSVINQVSGRDKMNAFNPHIFLVSKEII